MKKKSTLIELLKLLGMTILGWFLWLWIFTITITPAEAEETIEPFQGASFIFGMITALIIWLFIQLTWARKGAQNIQAKASNIQIVADREKGLLDKANRVVDKYLNHEKSTFVETAAVRSSVQGKPARQTMIRSSHDFYQAIESYPELKVNESVMKLLEQIADCENTVANFKISYNDDVAKYNSAILNAPSFLRNLFGLKVAEFYNSHANDDEITDEMLGI
ncbi:LemA protein [Lachnospiraceae bacterium PM6-15]|uniref:LemA family protein n=1 Tax=Ohessyouella blattaphilus TaxID=2949333 RepID=UPI003E28A4C5